MANTNNNHSNFGLLDHVSLPQEQRSSGLKISGTIFGVHGNERGDAGREKGGHPIVNASTLEEISRQGSLGQGNNAISATVLKGDGILTVVGEKGGAQLCLQRTSEQQRRLLSGINGKEAKRAYSIEEQHSSTAGGGLGGSSDSPIGLELGKRTYFEASAGGGGGGGGTTTTTSAISNSAPAKKPRSTASGGQVPKCQVEGCKTDLTSAKDYHRRHKVCAVHSKAGRVMVAGQEQRFCQQCSRFHGLSEFDEGKRSCRRRLAGHNERRRKPQPDSLALNARLPSSFHDRRMLGNIFTDRSSFLPHLRISGIPTLWDEPDEVNYNHGKGSWPRMLKFEDQSSFEGSFQGSGIERQLFLTGLSQHSNDRSSLLLLQSPKGMTPVATDVDGQRMHHYLQGSVGLLGQGLTLSPSSGAGVLSGLEATPVSQCFTGVSDSGRALSLQSTAQLWSSRTPVAVSLDMSATQSNMMANQFIDDNPTSFGHLTVHAGQQQHFEWMNDKLLPMSSNPQSLSSGTGYSESGSISVEKEQQGEGVFTHGLDGVGNYECHAMFSMLQGQVPAGDISQDVKPTIDLMRISSASHCQKAQTQVSPGPFQQESSHFGEFQALRLYESSIFDSQQMM